MVRSPCCGEVGLKKGLWTREEDQKLLACIEQHGCGSWHALAMKAGLQRCGKSCRLRWTNYLRPDIKRGKFSFQEEQTIIQLHALIGNKWSVMATHLPMRTDNEIKNHWNAKLKQRLTKMGIDPVTHKPCSGSLCATAELSHTTQWESARLEAEARLVRQSKLLATFPPRGGEKPLPAVARPPCLDVLKAWQAQIPSSSSSSSAFPAVMAPSGDHQDSPTSAPSFPPGSCMFPTAKEASTQMLPLNDMSYHNNVFGSPQWFGVNEGFPDLLVSEYNGNPTCVGENYVAGGEDNHGTTGIVSDEDKNQWNNILMNLVTLNDSFSGSNNVVFQS